MHNGVHNSIWERGFNVSDDYRGQTKISIKHYNIVWKYISFLPPMLVRSIYGKYLLTLQHNVSQFILIGFGLPFNKLKAGKV
jgi:hypothetical protein